MLDKLFFPNKKLQIAERQLVSLRDELNRALERLKDAEKYHEKHESSKEQNAELKKRKTEVEQSLRQVENERWELARETRSLNGQISKLRKEIIDNSTKYSDQVLEVKRYKERCDTLEEQLQKSEYDLNLAKKQNQSQEVNIKDLNISIEKTTKIIDAYKNEIIKLNEKLAELSRLSSSDVLAMKSKARDLESMLQETRNALHVEQTKVVSLNQLGEKHRNEIRKLKDFDIELRSENARLKAQITSQKSETKAQSKVHALLVKLSIIEEKYEDLRRENDFNAEKQSAREAYLLERLEREKKINESLRRKLDKAEQFSITDAEGSPREPYKAPEEGGRVAGPSESPIGKGSLSNSDSSSANTISNQTQSSRNENNPEEDAWNKLLGQGIKLKLKPFNLKNEDVSQHTLESSRNLEFEFNGPFRVSDATEKSLNNTIETLTKVFALIEKNPKKYLNFNYTLEYLKRNLNATVRVTDIAVLTISVSSLQRTDFRASCIFNIKITGTLDQALVKQVEKTCSLSLLALTIEVPTPWHLYVFRFIKAESIRLSLTKESPKNEFSAWPFPTTN